MVNTEGKKYLISHNYSPFLPCHKNRYRISLEKYFFSLDNTLFHRWPFSRSLRKSWPIISCVLTVTIHTDRFMPLSLLEWRQNSCQSNFTCPMCIDNLVLTYQVWAMEVLTNRIMRKHNTDLKIDGERWQKSALFFISKGDRNGKSPCDMLIKRLLRKRQIWKAETGAAVTWKQWVGMLEDQIGEPTCRTKRTKLARTAKPCKDRDDRKSRRQQELCRQVISMENRKWEVETHIPRR